MKKLFFIISIMFMSITPSFADIGPFTVEGFGAYVGADEMKNQVGFGGGFGMGILEGISLQYRMVFTEREQDVVTDHKKTYENEAFLFGVQYVPAIPLLQKFRVSWNSTLYGGVVKTRYYQKLNAYPWKIEFDDDGYQVSFWTGPHFDVTQYISVFTEFGYNYNVFSGKMQEWSIQGFQALIGARCTLFGSRDYTQGY